MVNMALSPLVLEIEAKLADRWIELVSVLVPSSAARRSFMVWDAPEFLPGLSIGI